MIPPPPPPRSVLSRWDRMPRAHRDRLGAYALRGFALLFTYVGAQVAIIFFLATPSETCGTAGCYDSGTLWSGLPGEVMVAFIGIEIAILGLLVLSISAFLFARSVLRQFD
jgi:hypothetical protein